MKEKQKLKINNNMWLKVLSVGIAILLWLLVTNINDPVMTKRFTDITVEVINEDALTDSGYAYEIVEGETCSFTIQGKRSIVFNMTEADFSVVADFSKLSLTDAVPIDVSSKKYSDQIEITLGNTNTMKIEKDEIVNVSLPVNVSITGDVEEGYYPGETTATPNLIKVTGPKNLLSDAKEIRAEVDASGIGEDITVAAKPILYDKEGNTIESSQISMDASSVLVSIGLWETKSVNVNLSFEGEPESGYVMSSFDYQPKTVLVAVSPDIYDELESLDLASVSLDGVSETYEEDIPVSSDSFPDGVILAEELSSIKVSAKIEKKVSRKLTFSSSDITIKNNTSKYKVTYDSSNEYYINIEGPQSTIGSVKIDEFDPWIDLEYLEEGEHEILVHVKEDGTYAVNSTPDIRITLSE